MAAFMLWFYLNVFLLKRALLVATLFSIIHSCSLIRIVFLPI
jgi:hypothetical protein